MPWLFFSLKVSRLAYVSVFWAKLKTKLPAGHDKHHLSCLHDAVLLSLHENTLASLLLIFRPLCDRNRKAISDLNYIQFSHFIKEMRLRRRKKTQQGFKTPVLGWSGPPHLPPGPTKGPSLLMKYSPNDLAGPALPIIHRKTLIWWIVGGLWGTQTVFELLFKPAPLNLCCRISHCGCRGFSTCLTV